MAVSTGAAGGTHDIEVINNYNSKTYTLNTKMT